MFKIRTYCIWFEKHFFLGIGLFMKAKHCPLSKQIRIMRKIYDFWDVTPCYWTMISRRFEMMLLRNVEDY